MNCRLQQPQLQGVDKNENLPTKSCVIIIARTTLKCNRKQVGFLPKQGGFLWAECRKSAEIPAVHLFCEKNRKIRVDKTNRLWYSVLATRLDKSNHVAPEKRKPLQGLLRKPDPPWQSCGAVSGDPQVCRGEATPSCLRKTALWLKSPTGAFIAAQTPIPPFHSLFQVSCGFSLLPRLDARHSV